MLVWSNLIEFLKEVITRYPQVKKELFLSENKLLEQVLISYISDLPKNSLSKSSNNNNRILLEVYGNGNDVSGNANSFIDEGAVSVNSHSNTSSNNVLPLPTSSRRRALTGGGGVAAPHASSASSSSSSSMTSSSSSSAISQQKSKSKSKTAQSKKESSFVANLGALTIIEGKRPNKCFFCHTSSPECLVPACNAWIGNDNTSSGGRSESNSISGSNSGGSIKLCTPFTEIVRLRDESAALVQSTQSECESLRLQHAQIASEKKKIEEQAVRLVAKVNDLESRDSESQLLLKDSESQLQAERRQRDVIVQEVIFHHNAQLSELKRLHKALLQKAVSSQDAAVAKKKNTGVGSQLVVSVSAEGVHTGPMVAGDKKGGERRGDAAVPVPVLAPAAVAANSTSSSRATPSTSNDPLPGATSASLRSGFDSSPPPPSFFSFTSATPSSQLSSSSSSSALLFTRPNPTASVAQPTNATILPLFQQPQPIAAVGASVDDEHDWIWRSTVDLEFVHSLLQGPRTDSSLALSAIVTPPSNTLGHASFASFERMKYAQALHNEFDYLERDE